MKGLSRLRMFLASRHRAVPKSKNPVPIGTGSGIKRTDYSVWLAGTPAQVGLAETTPMT